MWVYRRWLEGMRLEFILKSMATFTEWRLNPFIFSLLLTFLLCLASIHNIYIYVGNIGNNVRRERGEEVYHFSPQEQKHFFPLELSSFAARTRKSLIDNANRFFTFPSFFHTTSTRQDSTFTHMYSASKSRLNIEFMYFLKNEKWILWVFKDEHKYMWAYMLVCVIYFSFHPHAV